MVLSGVLLLLISCDSSNHQPNTGPSFSYERIAQAPVDETFCSIGDTRNYWAPDVDHPVDADSDDCMAKRNGGYVWAMAGSGDNLWFGTNNNGWCGWLIVTGIFSSTETSRWVCESSESNFPNQSDSDGNPIYPENGVSVLADWRPPAIYYYNVTTE